MLKNVFLEKSLTRIVKVCLVGKEETKKALKRFLYQLELFLSFLFSSNILGFNIIFSQS